MIYNTLSPAALLDELLDARHQPAQLPALLSRLIGNERFVLYGAGSGLITFAAFVLQKHGLRPEAIVDRKFAMPTTWNGVPAMNLADFVSRSGADTARLKAVVTIGKREFHDEVVAQLGAAGFASVMFASDIYEYHLPYALPGFELEGAAFFRQRERLIRDGFALFSDERSREIYVRLLMTHIERRPIPIQFDPLEDQYFPADVALNRGKQRFVSCGAYDGDTVRQFNRRFGKVERIACFEPDADNFRRLSAYLEAERDGLARSVEAFPMGVGAQDALLRFGGGQQTNSAFSDGGGGEVRCVALDDVMSDFHPTMITMDIEGGELGALRGAQNTLRSDQPDLAISIYHRPQDLWELPLFLHSVDAGYRFFLRNYTGFPAESVLYATACPS